MGCGQGWDHGRARTVAVREVVVADQGAAAEGRADESGAVDGSADEGAGSRGFGGGVGGESARPRTRGAEAEDAAEEGRHGSYMERERCFRAVIDEK